MRHRLYGCLHGKVRVGEAGKAGGEERRRGTGRVLVECRTLTRCGVKVTRHTIQSQALQSGAAARVAALRWGVRYIGGRGLEGGRKVRAKVV